MKTLTLANKQKSKRISSNSAKYIRSKLVEAFKSYLDNLEKVMDKQIEKVKKDVEKDQKKKAKKDIKVLQKMDKKMDREVEKCRDMKKMKKKK